VAVSSIQNRLKSGLAKLLAVRWLGQIVDGVFQSALASFVLFSPERQANPVAAALAFSVVLLPYSVVGPYVGTLLDRFSRQRIVQFSNYARGANLIIIALLIKQSSTGLILTFFVLIAFGINRLILAGLSAGLPLVVLKEKLVVANALAVTGGTIGVVIGGGIGIGLKKILDHRLSGDRADALVILIGCLGYVISGLLARRLRRFEIGPRELESTKIEAGWREMIEGFSILRSQIDSLRGILATAIQRGGLTALTMMVLLLERNTYHDPTNPDAGLSGFAAMLTIAGLGIAIGAFISPYIVRILGRYLWIRLAMVVGTPSLLLYIAIPNQFTIGIAAFLLAMCGQAVKVTNDALVQSKIHDEFRGRVFSFYDMAVNAAIVTGASVAALVLPKSGESRTLPIIIVSAFALTSLLLLRNANFRSLSTTS
jgi:MFS family permease